MVLRCTVRQFWQLLWRSLSFFVSFLSFFCFFFFFWFEAEEDLLLRWFGVGSGLGSEGVPLMGGEWK